MKFFWYVKALYIMHDTKMTKMIQPEYLLL